MFVPFKQPLEKWTPGCQDHPVSFHLLAIFTHQGDISEVLVFSQIPKGNFDIFLEVVPLETQLLWHCFWSTANLWIGLDRWQLWNTTHQYIHKFWIQSWRKHDKLSYPWRKKREKEIIFQKEVSFSKRGKVKVISVRTRRSFLLLSGWQCDQWRRGDRSVSPNIDTHQRSNNRLSFLNGSLIQHFILWSVFRWSPFFSAIIYFQTNGNAFVYLGLESTSQDELIHW